MHRNLWLGTAVLGLVIGISAPAGAQQYFTHFKDSDKPPVEVNMSVLNASRTRPPGPWLGPVDHSAASKKTRVADYSYLRSPVIEPDTPPPPAAAPVHTHHKSRKAAAATEPTVEEPAAPHKKKKTKTAKKHRRHRPSLIITDAPGPDTVLDSNRAIVSQPPVMGASAPARVHHDIGAGAPIISNPPDRGAPPVVQQSLRAAPAAASSPAVMPSPDVLKDEEAELAREAAPEPHASPELHVAPEPAPETYAAPAPRAPAVTARRKKSHERAVKTTAPRETPREEPAVTAAPRERLREAEERPLATPLPDIKIVHDADNPEVAEPLPLPQPEIRRMPRDEPLPLPKAGKIGKTTAPMLVPRPGLGRAPALPPPVSTPSVEAEPVIEPPIAAPAPTAAPPDDMASALAMPVVPSIADLTLSFSGNSSDLSPETQKKLDAVIHQMSEMADGRLQVRGYAAGEDGSKSSARRIALSRVLSVRSYLMDKGIKPTRVDVRALGTETDRSPIDRVDLLFVR